MELSVQPIRIEARRGVTRVTLVDAERRNALGRPMLEGLRAALSQAGSDPSCRAIVLCAEGESFCSGVDLEAVFSGERQERALFRAFADCLLLICQSSVPVIACVGGSASGGGVGLAAAADIVIAAESAVFMLPEVIVGMIPAIISPFLLRRLPPARVRYLALSTRGVGAREAAAFGLVDEVAPDAGLEDALSSQLSRVLRSSPDAIAASKRHLEVLADDLERRVAHSLEELATWVARPAIAEGAGMFVDGQTPPWFSR